MMQADPGRSKHSQRFLIQDKTAQISFRLQVWINPDPDENADATEEDYDAPEMGYSEDENELY